MSRYIVIRRRYYADTGSYRYESVWDGLSLFAAEEYAERATGELWDILIICDMAYVSNIPAHAIRIYVIYGNGMLNESPNLANYISGPKTWLLAWEGQDVRADDMLRIALAAGVKRKLVVSAACVCARTALKYLPEGEDRPRTVIETAYAWSIGGRVDVNKAKNLATKAAYESYGNSKYPVFASAYNVIQAINKYILASTYDDPASSEKFSISGDVCLCQTVRDAASATGNHETAIRDLSELVREIIPLNTVLIAAIR